MSAVKVPKGWGWGHLRTVGSGTYGRTPSPNRLQCLAYLREHPDAVDGPARQTLRARFRLSLRTVSLLRSVVRQEREASP